MLVFLWWVVEKGPVEVATQLNQAYHVLIR